MQVWHGNDFQWLVISSHKVNYSPEFTVGRCMPEISKHVSYRRMLLIIGHVPKPMQIAQLYTFNSRNFNGCMRVRHCDLSRDPLCFDIAKSLVLKT